MEKNNGLKNGSYSNIFLAFLEKWGDKWWFKLLSVFLILWIVMSPILSTVINNKLQKPYTIEVINKALDTRQEQDNIIKRESFERNKQSYSLIKNAISQNIEATGSDYIFMIEYHNGTENVMTGIHFCRFDFTVEIMQENREYIPLDMFKDDLVARYDILLNENLNKGRIIYCNDPEKFSDYDKVLSFYLKIIEAKSFAMLNLKDAQGETFGSLMCVSLDKEINVTEVASCAREVENIVNLSATK